MKKTNCIEGINLHVGKGLNKHIIPVSNAIQKAIKTTHGSFEIKDLNSGKRSMTIIFSIFC